MNAILNIIYWTFGILLFVIISINLYTYFTPIVFYRVHLNTEQIGIVKPVSKSGWFIGDIASELTDLNITPNMIMNAGMYDEFYQPVGLYVENQYEKKPLITAQKGYGNFFLGEHGVFYIDKNGNAHLGATSDVKNNLKDLKIATQSGPMLVKNGNINNKFIPNSKNLELRNGVCVKDEKTVVFAISRRRVNLFDFAQAFKQEGCDNALYLDGSISRARITSKLFWSDGLIGPALFVYDK